LVAAEAGARMPKVGVVVRNMRAAPTDVVEMAEAACERFYEAAGIRISWVNSVEDVSWEGPDTVIRALVLPHAPPSRVMGAFGTALRNRQELLLYHDRIVAFAKTVDMPAHLMMSTALIHEIGHLLLDSEDHTRSGIMKGEWGLNDLNAIRRGELHFASSQIRCIKANIEQRSSRAR
jgi:hypothetical protein